MRDPTRMDRILSLVLDVWLENPDYRLGQLLINAMRPAEPHPEIFAYEDDKLEQMLKRHLDEIRKARYRGGEA